MPFLKLSADLEPRSKFALLLAYDFVALLTALWASFSIRLGVLYWPANKLILMLWIAAAATALVAFQRLGTYRMIIRYLDTRAGPRIAMGALAAAAIWFVIAYLSKIDMPRSVGFIYFGLVYLLLYYSRVLAAALLTRPEAKSMVAASVPSANPIPVVIYGANAAGVSLAASILRQSRYKLRFFVDDNPEMVGRTILGHRIRATSELAGWAQGGAVQQVFLALPQATRNERIEAVSSLSGLNLKVLSVPSHDEILRGKFTLSDVRPLDVKDLLERDVVPPVPHLLKGGIEGCTVLVTGAGGSIGSEICRQVLRCAPKRLVLLDHSEFNLYRIEKELNAGLADDQESPRPEIVAVLGSMVNELLLTRTLGRWSVDTVYHAAAYKHVPLLEDNEIVGVENNVLGTKALADACVAHGVKRFTMISTDKAVRPTNVMGSSKRVAELYIQALAQEPGVDCRFGIVRFGNVLDSSGSVVQQFRAQILEGGPITVTHPAITRFFMSIPEATQLVLQASSMALKGEVFVLDMGEPLRIVDLARTMVALSGLTERTPANPYGDIQITYVGLRPGEKLHEELFVGEMISATEHPQIKKANEPTVMLRDLQWSLQRIHTAVAELDAAALRVILGELLERDSRWAA
ncbi:MAG TPA: nucleoside-diphosphate sugar epimerase/dehydratase [Sphingomonadaceae bacterium]|nr:nucleoside-diphosphate sugar epimerase/dehydratase [Sphingomonadaceae bacterium]